MVTFRKVTQPKYISYKDAKPGDLLVEGTYAKKEMVPGFEGKGTVPQFTFITLTGEKVILNSAGHLNYLLDKEAKEGDYVRLTYLGKETLRDKKTGKLSTKASHQFELEVADENPELEGYEGDDEDVVA